MLFNDTIEGNIAMGKAGASHEEIVEVARIAIADCFITEAPEGYRTNIGDQMCIRDSPGRLPDRLRRTFPDRGR